MAVSRHRRLIFWLIMLLLYAITWLGGMTEHARDLAAMTQIWYRCGIESESAERRDKTFGSSFHPDGPMSGVYWSIPLLPGILLVDSYYSLGPIYSRGSAKIVLYYGVGTVTVCSLWGWLA
jgi:hypothetical protein